MKLLKKNQSKRVQNRGLVTWMLKNNFYSILPFLGVIIVWEALAYNVNPDLLPSPILVGKAIIELAEKGVLFNNIIASLFRVFSGFLLAVIFAIPLGIILGWYKKAGNTFSPLIEVLRTISPISWIPLAILWFGIGNIPAIFIIFITSFFPILIGTMHACHQIDKNFLRVAENFGARGGKLFRHVIIPATFPYIIISLRISLGISWVIIVAAEMVGLRSGLGYLIMDARNFLRTDFVIAGMVTIGIIGYIIDRLMLYLVRKFGTNATR